MAVLVAACPSRDSRHDSAEHEDIAERLAHEYHASQRGPLPDFPGPGTTLTSAEMVVPPRTDVFLCSTHEWRPEQDTLVTGIEHYQQPGGHHLDIYTSTRPRPVGDVYPCAMTDGGVGGRPVLLTLPGRHGNFIPDGHAIRLKAGTPLIILSHYINQRDEPLRVRDRVRIHFAEADAKPTLVNFMMWGTEDLDIPPGPSSVPVDCRVAQDMELLFAAGHLHEHGSRFRIEHIPERDETAARTFYDQDNWIPIYRDLPPIHVYGVDQAVRLRRGDRLRMHCDYDNRTGQNVGFPEEMCAAVTLYRPDTGRGFILCSPYGAVE